MSYSPQEQHDRPPVPPVPSWAGAGAQAPRRPGPRDAAPGRWVAALALALLVVGCLAAPLALFGFFIHGTLIDEDGYVATMTRLAARPAVRDAVAAGLSKAIAGAVGDAASSALPEELGGITDALTGALPIEDLTDRFVEEALESPGFADVWAEANRTLHPLLLDVIENAASGDKETSPVPVDLTAVTGAVVDRLEGAGVRLPDPLPQALTTGRIPLMDSILLQRLGKAIVTIDRLRIPLAILAVVAVAAGILAARDRLRAAVFAGAGMVAAMAAVEIVLAFARGSYLETTDKSHISHAASAAVFDVVTRDLRLWGWILLVLGAVAVAAGLAASRLRRGRRTAA